MILRNYTLRQMISPFFIGFSVVTFLLVMDLLLDHLQLILEKGVPVFTVLKLFLLALGWMMALSIPCGVLVGTLMSFGRMAQDNEILAVRSSGISLSTLLLPAFLWGIFWTGGLLAFNNYVLPWSNHQFAVLLHQISRQKPAAELDEGVFIEAFDGNRLLFDRLDPRTGEIEGIKLLQFDKGKRLITRTARRGRLSYDADLNSLILDLENGEINEVPDDAPDAGVFRRTEFQTQQIIIGGPDRMLNFQDRKRGQREMSASQLRSEIEILEEKIDATRAEQDERLRELGYSGYDELAAFVTPPPGWLQRVVGRLRGQSPPAPPPGGPRFVGPPDIRTLENFKMAQLQIESLMKRVSQLQVEYHKKFSISFACLVFVFMGAPLGMLARRGGVRAGFLSVAFFLFYYLCLVGGEQLADRRLLQPWLGMWIANIILGALALYFTARLSGWRVHRRG